MLKSLSSVQLVPFHSSVLAPPDGTGSPPKAKADGVVPAAASCCLAVFKSLTSVQDDPFHSSTFATDGGPPPIHNEDVLLVPAPIGPLLEVFILDIAVHEDPFQDSAALVGFADADPPAAIADVAVPPCAISCLVVFKLATSVQPDPFHDSVLPVAG